MSKSNPYILLADDDQDDRYFMNISFAEIGWNNSVKMVDSGEAVIRYLDTLPLALYPSLIVLDYNMPRMSGGATLAYLKTHEHYKDIPVVIYSTGMTPVLKNQLLTSGASSCFVKVSDQSKLVEMVRAFKAIAETSAVLH